MRDRRNTNLSISSVSTVSSMGSPVMADTKTATQQDAEKGRFLWIPSTTTGQPLPSPLLKHARESQQSILEQYQPRFHWRRLVLILGLVAVFLCYHCSFLSTHNDAGPSPIVSDNRFFFNGGAAIPQDPTPLIFQDNQGKSRWTVSIPSSLAFPLRPHQYKDICQASDKVSKSVESMNGRSRIMGKNHHEKRPYYAVDKAFVDAGEAESMGLLPHADAQKLIAVVGRSQNDTDVRVCDRTLTFVMETENAGFGNSLLALWMAYGLAKKEGREFFVDDSNWPYGQYTSYFPAPPQPSCRPPPAHQILPCPHSARHLVASAATLSWTFGSAFTDEFKHPRRNGVNKNRGFYDMIRTGYEDLFSLIGEDAAFVEHKLSVLRTASEQSGSPIVGMHIRRGDRHPYELEFSNDYLPFERYTSAATSLLSSLAPNFTISAETPASLLVASDDPDIYDSPELINTLSSDIVVSRSQERIVLASKKTLAPAVPIRNGAYTKHVDENSGWEGGFYSALFFGLGGGHPSTTEPTDQEKEIIHQATALRGLVGRGYILDLAVLGRADGVVCASSSAACRVMGVMMGWDKVAGGQWNNIDAGRYWSWDGQL